MKALVSLYDKTGPFPLVRALQELGITILATEGTAKALANHGVHADETRTITGFSDLLGGGIKTIHPAVHEAIATGEIGIVIVGLMPVDDASGEGLSLMDLGGVLLLRSAIKHHDAVVAVACPTSRGDDIIAALQGGSPLQGIREECALEAMEKVVEYERKTLARLKNMNKERTC